MRTKLIAGNWKMNKTPSEVAGLINSFKEVTNDANCTVLACVPYICISKAMEAASGTKLNIGAQNMAEQDSGAYTGEISADMLKDCGVQFVVIGHSERREYYNETNVSVNKKTIKALEKGLIPIVCVGEKLEEREQGITADLIRLQTKIAFNNISKDDAKAVVIAYEPVWAIGTGKTATDEQAEEVCKLIRDCVCELYGCEVSDGTQILYGGSMNAANAKGLLAMPNIDGGLIGGASLKGEDFTTIINACK